MHPDKPNAVRCKGGEPQGRTAHLYITYTLVCTYKVCRIDLASYTAYLNTVYFLQLVTTYQVNSKQPVSKVFF